MVKVELAVYDLSNGMASQLSEAILGQRIDGIWHTGVVVFGREYFFGGGIQNLPAGSFTTSNGMRPCQTLLLGDTQKSQAELESYLRSISLQYTQATYDLINHNCNNFSNAVSIFLLSTGIPTHIVDLPRIVFSTPGGMMLRPMIESMQNGIAQSGGGSGSGGGLDPFGGGMGGGGAPLATLSNTQSTDLNGSTLSNTVTTTSPLVSAQQITTTTTVRTFTPTPEEKAFVSAEVDTNTLNVLCNKILNYSASGEQQPVLVEGERQELSTTIAALSAASLSSFPHRSFVTLVRLTTVKPLQMASLFILRLLALHPPLCGEWGTEQYASSQRAAQSLLTMLRAASEGGPGGFSSPATLVMALCTLSNLVSSSAGCDLLFYEHERGDSAETAAEARVSVCVDACAWGLSHSKPEVRQMSATLCYNLSLAHAHVRGDSKEDTGALSTQSIVITQDARALPWRSLHVLHGEEQGEGEGEGGGEELHHHIVQILCAVMESVGDEADAVSLGRKLHAAYYVCVAGGEPAAELLTALGFDEHLLALRDKTHLLTETDRARLSNFELLLHGP